MPSRHRLPPLGRTTVQERGGRAGGRRCAPRREATGSSPSARLAFHPSITVPARLTCPVAGAGSRLGLIPSFGSARCLFNYQLSLPSSVLAEVLCGGHSAVGVIPALTACRPFPAELERHCSSHPAAPADPAPAAITLLSRYKSQTFSAPLLIFIILDNRLHEASIMRSLKTNHGQMHLLDLALRQNTAASRQCIW